MYILELLDILDQGIEFCVYVFTIYYAYLNELQFKYYIGWGWGVWGHAYFAYSGGGIQNSGKPAYIILACSLTEMDLRLNKTDILFIDSFYIT